MEPNQDRRRGHFHRSRRGSDRRGPDRRVQQPPANRDQVNVEQIMREIRTRVAERQGVELTNEQIQDLAARRLESILDPRSIKPSLLEGLRRSAGSLGAAPGPKMSSEPVYTFDDTTIYDSHRAVLRFVRRLLNPLLKLFFNPNPLIRAMHLQARLNVEAAERDAERDRRQAEWNALHYELLQRLVTEVSRVSLESQALSTRVESLDARIAFADRRVRALEASLLHGRTGARADVPAAAAAPEASGTAEAETEGPVLDPGRRRRRRRRGRRPGVMPEIPATGPDMTAAEPEEWLDSGAAPDVSPGLDVGADVEAGAGVSPPSNAAAEASPALDDSAVHAPAERQTGPQPPAPAADLHADGEQRRPDPSDGAPTPAPAPDSRNDDTSGR